MVNRLKYELLPDAYSLTYGMSEQTIRSCIAVGWGVYWKEDFNTVFTGQCDDLFESRWDSERYMDFQ